MRDSSGVQGRDRGERGATLLILLLLGIISGLLGLHANVFVHFIPPLSASELMALALSNSILLGYLGTRGVRVSVEGAMASEKDPFREGVLAGALFSLLIPFLPSASVPNIWIFLFLLSISALTLFRSTRKGVLAAFLSSLLGLVALDYLPVRDPVFPALSGLFFMSPSLLPLRSRGNRLTSLLTSSLSLILFFYFPALSPGALVYLLSSLLPVNLSFSSGFLSVTTVVASLEAYERMGDVKTGWVLLLGPSGTYMPVVLLVSGLLTLYPLRVPSYPYRYVIPVLVTLVSGITGLLLFLTAYFLGSWADNERGSLLFFLIIPTLLYYAWRLP